MRDSVSQNYVLQQVIKMSLENAETFLNDAKLLINNSSFGHAFALTILALEEVGKAIYCNWAKNGFTLVNNNFLKGLKTHKTKQRVIKEIEKLVILKTGINSYKKSRDRRKIPFKSRSEMVNFLTELEESPHFKSVDAFYRELEKMKQLALYVDIDEDGAPSAPSSFTKDICDKCIDFVQKIFISTRDTILSKTKNKDNASIFYW